MTLAELKAAQPGLMAEHEREITTRLEAAHKSAITALETKLTEATAEAAEKAKAMDKPATFAELEAAIPEGTVGRADIIVEAQKKSLSATGALKLVTTKLTEANAAQTKRVGELEALNGAGKGGSAVPAGPPSGQTATELPPLAGDRAERREAAKKEWADNLCNCRDVFPLGEKAYIGWRSSDKGAKGGKLTK